MKILSEEQKQTIKSVWESRNCTVEFKKEEFIVSRNDMIIDRRSNEEMINFLEKGLTASKK